MCLQLLWEEILVKGESSHSRTLSGSFLVCDHRVPEAVGWESVNPPLSSFWISESQLDHVHHMYPVQQERACVLWAPRAEAASCLQEAGVRDQGLCSVYILRCQMVP